MKKCSICKYFLDYKKFSNSNIRKDGLQSGCKECLSTARAEYLKSKKGLAYSIYSHQKGHSKSRNHKLPTYTKQELKDWLYSQPLFHKLYDNWKRLDYQTDYRPSVDRIKNNIGYTVDNIQLMSWSENKEKWYSDVRYGNESNISNPQKAVIQFTKKGVFIAEYHSIMEAERQTGVSNSGIVNCCKGNSKTLHGYVWKYKGENYE